MRRKWSFVLLIASLPLLWISSAFSATKVYLPDSVELKSQLNAISAFAGSPLKADLGLGVQDGLELLREVTDESNVTHTRYQQTFDGMQVWGYHIIVATNPAGIVVGINGTKVLDIKDDVDLNALAAGGLSEEDVLQRMKDRHIAQSALPRQPWIFRGETSQKVI